MNSSRKINFSTTGTDPDDNFSVPETLSVSMTSKLSKRKSSPVAFKLPEEELDEKFSNAKKCSNFLDITSVCEEFVGGILQAGLKEAEDILLNRSFTIQRSTQEVKSSSSSSNDSADAHLIHLEFSGWPKIEQFSIRLGLQKLHEFMNFWMYEEDWLFDIEYNSGWSDLVQDYYLYESVWSIPTKEYPVAQATASIFFTYEVSRIKPKCCAVEIYYTFEGQLTKFAPTKETNPEKCLFSIVDAKLKFFETLRF
ncbi:uncharacterized protein [Onthophagus taurus]|uniref:uncharacterized protein n=1 Tax=Onthophagus taurus TaxID=166361 RepID=UPI0039BE51E4